MILQQGSTLNSLQMLRAIAALLVVFLHLETSYSVGAVGVDIFFVISGFVMAMVVQSTTNPVNFMLARFTRIAPLYWMATIATFLIALLFPQVLKTATANVEYLLKSLFFIPYYTTETRTTPLFGLGWTLVFEMIFYSFVAMALLITNKFQKMNVSFVSAIILLLFYSVCQFLPESYALVSYIKSQNTLQFLYGLAAFEIVKNVRFNDASLKKYYCFAIVFLIALMLYLEKDYLKYRVVSMSLPAFLIILMMVRLEDEVNTLPSLFKTSIIALGDASYAIYLVHTFVIYGVKKAIVPFMPFLEPSQMFGAVFTFVACVMAGLFVHKFVDMPMVAFARRGVKSLHRPYSPQKV